MKHPTVYPGSQPNTCTFEKYAKGSFLLIQSLDGERQEKRDAVPLKRRRRMRSAVSLDIVMLFGQARYKCDIFTEGQKGAIIIYQG